MSRHVRTTISIPSDLKTRMEATQEAVNWSAVAAEAFERKLAEFITKRGAQNVEEVISRLRATLAEGDSEEYQGGHEAGIEWARSEATASELKRLDKLRNKVNDWDDYFVEAPEYQRMSGQYHIVPARIYFVINPKCEEEYSEAGAFYEAFGFNDLDDVDPQWVKGFVEGALSVWGEVKNQL